MDKRQIQLNISEARELYDKGDANIKSLLLTTFTKEELTIQEWQNIKTFEDACKALNLDYESVLVDIRNIERLRLEVDTTEHVQAIYKLDIIHKALNGDWKPSLVQGSVYYPYVKFYPAGQKAREAAFSNNCKLGKSLIANGKKYTLVGSDNRYYNFGGLAYFGCGYGDVLPQLGLLGCKSKEIAKHMSRYFSKEIFEATYAHHVGTYQWV